MNRLAWSLISLILGVLLFLIWPLRLEILDDPHSVILEDRSGDLLSAQIASDGQWRFPMIDSVPQAFIHALTTYEDKRFYHHIGIDFRAMIRAFRQNIQSRKIVSGASTITMQLMRMSQRNKSRTWLQKIKEAILAIKLECQYSKKEILEMYVSNAPFGGNVVGIEAASWRYFNKSPNYLSWAETATLAVLPNAPSLVTLTRNRERLLGKRNALLKRISEKGWISQDDLELAYEEPLIETIYQLPSLAPHLLEQVKKDRIEGRIITTVNKNLQFKINRLLDQEWRIFSQNRIENAAIVILNTASGEVLAYGANVPHTQSESAVDMIQARRSSGSILKPFLFASMIDAGAMTPNSLVYDIPIFIDGFNPSNYNRSFSGAIPASEALTRSLNIPFVLMLQRYGVEKFTRRLNQLGLSSIDKSGDHYGLSLILGGGEVSLWELTQAYAQMGQALLTPAESLKDRTSIPINSAHYYKNPNTFQRQSILSASAIWHTLEAMRQVQRPDEHGQWEIFSSSKNMAWKTGTSYGHRDAWAVGVTPDYTIGVWVGNADGEGRDQLTGVTTAGKVLFDAADLLNFQKSWFAQPYAEMYEVALCRESGMLPSVHCIIRDTLWVSKKMADSPVCPYHQTYYTDGNWRYYQQCTADSTYKMAYLNLPPLVEQYYKVSHGAYGRMPPLHPDCQSMSDSGTEMQMIYPNPGEIIYVPRDFNNDRQKVIAQVAHKNTSSTIYWYLNDQYLGETQEFHTMSIDFTSGHYNLQCIDQNGTTIQVNFEIVNQ
jgi:penicillin-binding protein 1C